MQVSIEPLEGLERRMTVQIPSERVSEAVEKKLRELSKTVRIDGFRPGKVPRSALVRLFKKDIHADVTSRLIQSSFIDAVKETELKIVGNPQVDPPELEATGSYKYDATVEITPEIKDIDYSGLTLNRSNYRVSDEEIDAQLKMLQKNFARQQKIEKKRAVEPDDFVLIDFEGFKEGRSFAETAKTENFSLKIGEGPVLKEFDDQLVGMKPGDSKEFKVTFPEDYHNKKLAGLEISFQVTLNEIREEVLPAIDDALAKKAGQYENLDDLKKVIADNLEQGYAKRIEQELHEQIYSELISRSDFEVPDAMVEMELEGIVEEAVRSFAYRNITMEELGLTRESIAENYRDTAFKQVKRHLLLGKIIDQESLAVSDDELEDALNEMAENFKQPVEEIKKHYDQNKDKLEFFKHTLLEKKAIKLIIENSKIEDVDPEKEEADGKADKQSDTND